MLREGGDQDGALKALEHVTMLDPDHVGALALLGEINIRRGNFEEAAASLARLARLEAAPAKNRVTAGIAAVDLYENKLGNFDIALEVLLALHRAKLSTLRVRERLARAAARTGSWKEATEILQELMHERPEAEGRIEAARLAMAIHRDRLGNPQDGAPAIVKLLEEEPGDGEALDMLLQTAHPDDVRERLLRDAQGCAPGQPREAPDRSAVRAPPREGGARPAATTRSSRRPSACCPRSARPTPRPSRPSPSCRRARRGRRRSPSPSRRCAPSSRRATRAPSPTCSRSSGRRSPRRSAPTSRRAASGRRDKIDPRSGLALRNEIAAWAGAFGIREFDLYVGGKEPLDVQGIPGETAGARRRAEHQGAALAR